MPQTMNNDDIRIGMLHDYETRIWVNCNWIIDYIETLEITCCEPCSADYVEQACIFQYLGDFPKERFWKDFNYALSKHEDFRLPSFNGRIEEETYSAIRQVWTNQIEELKDDEFQDDCWNTATDAYKLDNGA